MRKFLSEGLEQFSPGSLGNENISMEEEAIIVDDANTDAEEADKELSEAERIIEVSDALEDMAVIVDGSDDPLTERETMLIENSGQMAVAGTDIEPEEIVPSMEAFKGMKVATEDFRAKARQIWEAILRFLKDIWSKIEGYFYKIFGTIPALRKRLKALESKIEAANSLEKDKPNFAVSSTKALTVGGTQVKTAAALDSALKDFAATADYVYGTYPQALKVVAGTLAKGIEEFDAEKPAEAAGKVLPRVKTALASASKIPGHTGGGAGSRWPRHTVEKGHPLLGGMSLFSLSPKDSIKTGLLGELEVIRAAGVVLSTTEDKPKAAPATVEFSTLSPAEAAKVLKDVEKILDSMEDYQRGKGAKDAKEGKAKLEAASKKAETAAGKLEQGATGEKEAATYYRALLNFNVSFARWVQNPIIPFTKHAFTAVRTSIVLVERSLAQYK